MQVKKRQLEPDMEQLTGSKLGKEYVKAVYCHCIFKLNLNKLSLFNLYAEYIMWNAGLDEAQPGIKFAWRKINYLRYPDDATHGRKPGGVKEPLHEGDACFLGEKLWPT